MSNQIRKVDNNSFERVKKLIEKTDKESPKPEDVKALRKFLDEEPKLFRIVGNLSKQVVGNLLSDHTKMSVLRRECIDKQIDEMQSSFRYDEALPLEKLLIEQIILCWLRVHMVEFEHRSNTTGSHSMKEGLYWDKRLSGAQRRFTRAVETLARVRKMQVQTELVERRKDFVSLSRANSSLKFLNAVPD